MKGLIELIKTRIDEFVFTEYGCRADKLKILRQFKRPYSCIMFFEMEIRGQVRRMVSKTIRHHQMNKEILEGSNQARAEFNILTEIYPQFISFQRFTVPRPLIYIPEIETYVMDFVEGNTLADEFRYVRYFSSMTGFRRLLWYLESSGLWLRNFQQISGHKTRSSSILTNVVKRCYQRLAYIEESGDRRIPTSFQSQIKNFISDQIESLVNEKIQVSVTHTDFSPFNILSSGNRITVIDFFGWGYEPLPVDIIKFLVFLEDDSLSLTASSSRKNHLINAFMDGYGALPKVAQPVVLICEVMQRVVSIWGSISNKSVLPHHRIDRSRRIYNHLEWLMQPNCETSLWYKYSQTE